MARPRKADRSEKKTPNIVSVMLPPRSKEDLDRHCDERGMTIKSLLGRLINWFVACDKTEQALMLGQLNPEDANSVADLVRRRKGG